MSYDLFLEPEVHEARRNLPGNVRQRLRRAIEDLATDPHPVNSDEMDSTELTLPPGAEIRRLKLDRWRVVYVMHEAEKWVWILGIYRRPPYNYEDLTELVGRLG